MAKRFCIVIFIVSLLALAGCTQPDSGISRRLPNRTRPTLGTGSPVKLTEVSEIDIVEQIAANRQAYRQGLEKLVRYYTKTGNNEKLDWANKELKALNVMPQYKYIVPVVASKDYRATTSIPDADLIYEDASLQKKQA
jgi:hypothetical protein